MLLDQRIIKDLHVAQTDCQIDLNGNTFVQVELDKAPNTRPRPLDAAH